MHETNPRTSFPSRWSRSVGDTCHATDHKRKTDFHPSMLFGTSSSTTAVVVWYSTARFRNSATVIFRKSSLVVELLVELSVIFSESSKMIYSETSTNNTSIGVPVHIHSENLHYLLGIGGVAGGVIFYILVIFTTGGFACGVIYFIFRNFPKWLIIDFF